jgi:HAD superfamily hydrolase (TIGR01509 family)
MDGVLVDSESLYMRFWQEACASFGYTLDWSQALSLRSNSPETATPKFRAWFGEEADYHAIRQVRREMMARYIDQIGVALKPGAAEVIGRLKADGLRLALATSSPLRRAEHYLAPHGILSQFDAVVCGTEVAHSKPAPDIYCHAAAALGLPPSECAAVEDSPSGIRSAHDAGCFTVMIPDLSEPDEEILPMIDCVLTSLEELMTENSKLKTE